MFSSCVGSASKLNLGSIGVSPPVLAAEFLSVFLLSVCEGRRVREAATNFLCVASVLLNVLLKYEHLDEAGRAANVLLMCC